MPLVVGALFFLVWNELLVDYLFQRGPTATALGLSLAGNAALVSYLLGQSTVGHGGRAQFQGGQPDVKPSRP